MRTARPTPVSKTTPRAYALRTTALSTSTLFSWASEVALIARSRPAARLVPPATALAVFFIIACAAALRQLPLLHRHPCCLSPDQASQAISSPLLLRHPA